MTDRDLGSFLRVRREALRPADVGLTPGGRRRTPGLRRQEVAMLANVSVDYYERLEQSRGSHPSEALIADLARALRLSTDERDYLYRLAGYPPPSTMGSGYVDPSLMFLLDTLTTVPAHIIDDLTHVLAQNRLSLALIGTWDRADGRYANVAWRWFTDPESRVFNVPEEWEGIGRGYVADLRAAAARRGRDQTCQNLIADLLAASAEFRGYWEEMHVAPLTSTRKRLVHPVAGELDVQCDVVLGTATGHRLVVFRPQPGSGTADSFDFLRVLGLQAFDS